jgi:hypothetical protein
MDVAMHACPAEFAVLYIGKRCILCCSLAESLLEYLGIVRVRLVGLLHAPLHARARILRKNRSLEHFVT